MAENFAALWLRLKWYRILARNWRSPYGEVDIIAIRGGQLVIVEVKSRQSPAFIGEAILTRQQSRLMRAALHFQQRHPQYRNHMLRFDAVLISGLYLRHIKSAWISQE